MVRMAALMISVCPDNEVHKDLYPMWRLWPTECTDGNAYMV